MATTSRELAEQLQAELARRNIPAHLILLVDGVSVALWPRLVAHTDGRVIWWTTPRPSQRGSALFTYAHNPARAAERLAGDYATVRRTPIGDLLDGRALMPWQAHPHPNPGPASVTPAAGRGSGPGLAAGMLTDLLNISGY